jgi:pilus assembly protein CpaE/pilus assembly protein CpaF
VAAQIITLLGVKGGEGTTTLAVNLAVDLRRLTNRKVLLLDFVLPFGGDANFLLGLETSRSMIDLAAVLPSLDPSLLRGYMTRHDSGIEVLGASLESSEEFPLSAEEVGHLLSLLGEVYDFIVVDAGSHISERLLAVLDRSHGVGLVLTPTLLALNQTRRLMRYLQEQHFSRERLHLIASMTARRGGALDPRTIEQNLKRSFLASIPADPAAVSAAAAEQVPICTADPRHPISKAISELSLVLAGAKGTGDGLLGQVALNLPPRAAAGAGASTALAVRGQPRDGSDPGTDPRRSVTNAAKEKVHGRLLQKLDLRRIDVDVSGDPDKARVLRDETLRAIVEILDEEAAGLLSRAERRRVAREILDEALGLGPLEDLLSDPTITEIMVNRADRIYVERGGRIELTGSSFISNRQLLGVIERIVSPLGRRIDESNPFVDARLPDGSRVNAVIPPVSVDGPMLTIRKFSKVPYQVADLVRFGSMTDEMGQFFQAAVVGRLNILISGGTGSGKTTLLNVLSAFIPGHERIITIEDAAELQLPQEHVGRLEARPSNIEGEGEVTIRDLVRNALRMRPDRIVVGECRGGEALDMLQAMNTGHDGSLTTVHANSPRDSLSRLETMVLFAGLELPSRAIRDQISAAVDLIIQTARFSIDGSRRITHVSHVQRMSGTEIVLKDVFIFRQTSTSQQGRVEGRFIPTGYVPPFVHEFGRRGIHLPLSVFKVKDHVDLQLLREWRQENEAQTGAEVGLLPA